MEKTRSDKKDKGKDNFQRRSKEPLTHDFQPHEERERERAAVRSRNKAYRSIAASTKYAATSVIV